MTQSTPNTAAEYDHTVKGAAIFDQSQRGKIELNGVDAVSFVHNLCTNDIKRLDVGSGCEAFLTTAKARIVARVFVLRTSSGLWLDTEAGQAETVRKHLDHFLISEQVEIADRTRDFAQFQVCGPQTQAILESVLSYSLAELQHLHQLSKAYHDTPMVVRRNDSLGLPGFDLLVLPDAAEAIWQLLLTAGALAASAEVHEILRIEAGLPIFGKEMDENRFVVEVGRIDQAICYTKGCYLGQEPIVMARDRGHVNRKLMGLTMSGSELAAKGARVMEQTQEVGQVTSSIRSPRFGVIALAYLRRGSWDPGIVIEVEATSGRQRAVVSTLPFAAQLP